eukprot:1106235-Amorphochlora_amoeboformis.AAC.1
MSSSIIIASNGSVSHTNTNRVYTRGLEQKDREIIDKNVGDREKGRRRLRGRTERPKVGREPRSQR